MSILTSAASTATPPSTDQRNSGVTVAIGAAPSLSSHRVELWATPDMDAYAYEAIYNPGEISLTDAEAAIRTQLAEFNTQVAGFLNEDGPLTAAQRGTDWMNRWGCIPQCVTDHTEPTAPEWHSTADVATELRDADLDTSGYSENGNDLPWLAARVTVANDKAHAYGRKTQVFLDYGVSIAEMDLAKAREALNAMRAFVAQLTLVVDQADRIGADDFEGDPEIARLDREAEDRRIKAIDDARIQKAVTRLQSLTTEEAK